MHGAGLAGLQRIAHIHHGVFGGVTRLAIGADNLRVTTDENDVAGGRSVRAMRYHGDESDHARDYTR